jgi:hypothetical protein
MNSEPEIYRLMDMMPASGRMFSKIVSKPEQRAVIQAAFPLPWMVDKPIYINFDLWSRLSRSQRDLTILRTVSWLSSVKWFKPDVTAGLVAIGGIGLGVELMQQDFVGIAASTALGVFAVTRIWRKNHSSAIELEADEKALQVAQRRGYSETDAARALLSAIEAIAQNEGRSLSFVELLRCQALSAIAGISPVGVPETFRRDEF